MKLHNIEYYENLWGKYQQFQENNEIRRKKNDFLGIERYIINPVSSAITKIIVSCSRSTYALTGRVFVKITSFFSKGLSNTIYNTWHDPISTHTMLKIGVIMQSILRRFVVRKPVSVPFFSYCDKVLLSLTRHAYIVLVDLNALLSIPQKLKGSFLLRKDIKTTPQSTVTQSPTSLLGRTWEVMQQGAIRAKEKLLILILLVIRVLQKIFIYIPLLEDFLKKLQKTLEEAIQKAHKALISRVHGIIDENERKIRHKVMANVAEAASRHMVKFVVSSTLRIGLVGSGYWCIKKIFTYYTGHHDLPETAVKVGSIGIQFLGVYFWYLCLYPTIKSLREEYREDFDPNASTILELSNLLDRKNLKAIFYFLKNKLL